MKSRLWPVLLVASMIVGLAAPGMALGVSGSLQSARLDAGAIAKRADVMRGPESPFSSRPASFELPVAQAVGTLDNEPLNASGTSSFSGVSDISAQALIFANGFEGTSYPWTVNDGWGVVSDWGHESNQSAYCPAYDDMDAWMVTNASLDLSGYSSATLTYRQWVDTEYNYDYLLGGVSSDGDYFEGWWYTGYSNGWNTVTIDMTRYCGDSSVWIGFNYSSDFSNYDWYEGAYVDNVVVTGTRLPANVPPVASDDIYITAPNTPKVVIAPGVLSNDYDADRNPMTAVKQSDPANGSVALNDNGSFIYTPYAGFSGTDSFSYAAYDGRAYSETVTVALMVTSDYVPLKVVNISGASRYATAVEASKLAFADGANYVVIATGANWPDALGGSALAGALDAPILLTRPDTLLTEVRNEIVRLGATHAIILGGTGAVSDAVSGEIAALPGMTVDRIAGASRYATANLVAARTIGELGDAYDGTAFVATGANFPDALGASPIAAANGWPIYLANPTQGGNAAMVSSMRGAGVTEAVILGGTGAVSLPVESDLWALGSVTRLAGTSRYDTAVQVASYGVSYGGLSYDRLAIATGENFPDALAGGVLQGKSGSVLLLTPTASLNPAVAALLTAEKPNIHEVRFLGGTGALTETVRASVRNAVAQ